MQPEHYDFASPVYLPVTAETCQALLDDATLLDTLDNAQLAAVLVIQNLAQAREQVLDPGAAEKVLAKLLAWAATGSLSDEAQRLFDARKLYFGLEVIKGSRLQLLSAEALAKGDYLLADGTWDMQYRVRRHHADNPFTQQTQTRFDKERWLTREQDKLLRVLRANPDEDLHVQGYAGIGKSYLLGALMDSLPKGRVLPLARTPAKLETLRKRMGGGAGKVGKTFGALAQELLAGPGRQPYKPSPRLPGKRAVAEELGILGFRQYGAEKTLDICLELLASYCESRDYSLSDRHLPHFEQPLARLDAQVLLEYASRLWTWLQANPGWHRHTGFPALLLLKRAALAGCSVPAHISHVIVDESQDMPGPLLQIIERGRQVLVTLGDEYQRAKGPVLRRQRSVRQRDIALSVRCGPQVERLINPLIGVHSQHSKLAFEGVGSVDVGIEFYPQDFLPPPGCVVLAASPWDAMKWALQLAGSGCGFGFADNADMQRFMATVVQLYRADFYGVGEAGQEAHPYFAHTVDWRQVREANRFDEAFLWVEAKLQDGFKVADLNSITARLSSQSGSLLLMRAEEAGGMEFDQVLLTPELMSLGKFKDAYEFDSRVCAVYIALSRARQRLYLPYDVEEWVAFHKGQKFRESHGY